jgi:hypothetical protein
MSPGADQHVCAATVLHDTARHIDPNLGCVNRHAAAIAAGMRNWDAATLSRRAHCLTRWLPAIACVRCAAADGSESVHCAVKQIVQQGALNDCRGASREQTSRI